MSKVLVAYFSTSGVTAKKAQLIAKAADADLYEIKPAEPYTEEDLDWKNKESRSIREFKDKSCRPALADKNANVAAYDTIFLGFPIWMYTCPSIVKTFLESYDFSGKVIYPFATSDGSRFGDTQNHIKECVAESTVVNPGKMVSGTQEYGITGWIKTLDL